MPFLAPAIPAILAATAVAGVGLQIYGTAKAASAAKSQNEYQTRIIADQQRQEALRQQAMELDNRRRQREAIRTAQKARAVAVAAAQNQTGNILGTGILGGEAQISGAENTNLLGLSQSLALGRANFDLSSSITNSRIGYAQAGGQAAFGAGLNSLGGGLVNSMGAIGRLSGIGGAYAGTGYSNYAYSPSAFDAYGAQGGYAY